MCFIENFSLILIFAVFIGNMDGLIDDVFASMAFAFDLPISRKRNRIEDSVTQTRLRPDFMLLVREALLFKMEDKSMSGSFTDAADDLLVSVLITPCCPRESCSSHQISKCPIHSKSEPKLLILFPHFLILLNRQK